MLVAVVAAPRVAPDAFLGLGVHPVRWFLLPRLILPGLQHRVGITGVLFAVRGVYGRVRGVFWQGIPARGHRGPRDSYRRVVGGE